MKEYNTLDDFDVRHKTVLLRVDINCPLKKDTLEIEDDNRIRQIVPTVRELLSKHAKVVILAHQGRPGDWDFVSLDRHAVVLSKHLGKEVRYVDDLIGEKAINAIRELQSGEAIILKNVRELSYEQEKKSQEEHAKSELVTVLAPLVDLYVNDAFAASHRAHCSLVGFPAVLPSAAGRLMEKELSVLKKLFENPAKPSVFVLGGAKVTDIVAVVTRLISKKIATMVILVGLSANAFLKARGADLGKTNEDALSAGLTQEDLEAAKKLLEEKGEQILLPHDVAIEVDGRRRELLVGDLPSEYPILDIGRASIEKFVKVIHNAKTAFMSGPAGMIEKKEFLLGTKELLTAMATSHAYTVIGGGHTVGVAESLKLADRLSYVSTGGGALETFLMGKPLPAVEALKAAVNRKL
ncbi:MAG: phosphoglycerate kinase [Methanomassiliicoccales archaeon]|nr:phosphoglycerate kinase [Methanomassiliicoccales archaeon]